MVLKVSWAIDAAIAAGARGAPRYVEVELAAHGVEAGFGDRGALGGHRKGEGRGTYRTVRYPLGHLCGSTVLWAFLATK